MKQPELAMEFLTILGGHCTRLNIFEGRFGAFFQLSSFHFCFGIRVGRTPKGAYSSEGCSGQLLETPFSKTPSENPSQNPFYCATHSKRLFYQNPSENPSPEPLPEPFLERCVAVRTVGRSPN